MASVMECHSSGAYKFTSFADITDGGVSRLLIDLALLIIFLLLVFVILTVLLLTRVRRLRLVEIRDIIRTIANSIIVAITNKSDTKI